jgi:leucyl aminopeptidase
VSAFKSMKTDQTYVFYEYAGAGTTPADVAISVRVSGQTKSSIFTQVRELAKATADRLCFAYTEHCYSHALDSIFKHSAASQTLDGVSNSKRHAKIVWPRVFTSAAPSLARRNFVAMARSYYLMKLMVDTPAISLGPAELEDVAIRLAMSYMHSDGIVAGGNRGTGAGTGTGTVQLRSYVGKQALLNGVPTRAFGFPPPGAKATSGAAPDDSSGRRMEVHKSASLKGFPQVWAVGMAAGGGREPRVVDFTWSPPHVDNARGTLPEIVLVGKGVVFDSGGLNIKTGNGMLTMKKDMAGAAQACALASLIMDRGLRCKLRVLIPIVENSVSGESLRPGDVIRSRCGKTSEITNTDAEGRLILADCLVAACESEEGHPSSDPRRRRLIIDFATLTGAARVALGNELAAVFSNDHTALMRFFQMSHDSTSLDSFAGTDPCWAMPLWEPMRKDLKSNIADIQNAPGTPGGAITAALYLSEFIAPLAPSADAGVAYLSAGLRRRVNRAANTAQSASDEDLTNGVAASTDNTDSEQAGAGVRTAQAQAAAPTPTPPPMWIHVDFFASSKGGRAIPQGMRTAFAFIQEHIQSQQHLNAA